MSMSLQCCMLCWTVRMAHTTRQTAYQKHCQSSHPSAWAPSPGDNGLETLGSFWTETSELTTGLFGAIRAKQSACVSSLLWPITEKPSNDVLCDGKYYLSVVLCQLARYLVNQWFSRIETNRISSEWFERSTQTTRNVLTVRISF